MTGLYRRVLPLVGAAVVLVVLGVGLGWGYAGDAAPVAPSSVALTTAGASASSVTGSWPARRARRAPTSFLVADAVVPQVALYAAPDQPLPGALPMANPTWEGLPVLFLVLDRKPGWLHVRVSRRPNDLTAWVPTSEVHLRRVPNRIVVSVGARRITVYHGDQVLLEETVAVGRPNTPTPLGHFFVDGIVQVPNSGGPYGPFQVSVSGFSNVLHSFGGGVGQIALHGTNQPQLLGQPVSNGCIRMSNDTITRVETLAPLGTPVTVVA